jgi:hypothetical protein
MRLPAPGRRARLLGLVYGGIIFLWFSVEDNAVWPVAALGAGLSALIVSLTTMDKIGGSIVAARFIPLLMALMGGVIGLGASVTVVALMFFKNALHAHIFPDFPPALMLAMLQRAPAWAAAGALLGCGLGLAWIALRTGVSAD